MEIKGKVIEVLPELTGEGKNGTWTKRAFIIETDGQYPKKVQIGAFGDKMAIEFIRKGYELNVHFNLESKEFNGKWYTVANAYKLELLGKTTKDIPKEKIKNVQDDIEDDLPF